MLIRHIIAAVFVLLMISVIIFFLNSIVYPLCNHSFWCSTINNTVSFLNIGFLVFFVSVFVIEIAASYAYPSIFYGMVDVVFMLGAATIINTLQPFIILANSLTTNSVAVSTVASPWFLYLIVILLLIDAIVNFFG